MDARRGLRLVPARLAPVVVLPLVAVAACNAITGAGDLTAGLTPPCEGCEAADGAPDQARPPPTRDASPDGTPVGSKDAATEAGQKPAYCDGIVFYLRFDKTLVSAEGLSPETPPALTYAEGKFGSSVLSTTAMGALYYLVSPMNGVPYSRAEGSMAMWLKPTWAWPSTVERVYYKPVPDHGVTLGKSSGPQVLGLPLPGAALFGASNTQTDGTTVNAAAPAPSFTAAWNDMGWNQLVETWSTTAPTLSFTLNGTMRHEANAPLTPEDPTLGFVRIGSDTYPIEAYVDDFAIWKRPLSALEIQALHASSLSLGDTCGL